MTDGSLTGNAGVTVDVGAGIDRDGDGLSDDEEELIGTDPDDADSDDDGALDGSEPDYDLDSDDDGTINALDPDSDNDFILDGTELSIVEPDEDTDETVGDFMPDADPTTSTDPTDPDTDDGSVIDGLEDLDRNGRIDVGETDPNDGSDDVPGDGPGIGGVPGDFVSGPGLASDELGFEDDTVGFGGIAGGGAACSAASTRTTGTGARWSLALLALAVRRRRGER